MSGCHDHSFYFISSKMNMESLFSDSRRMGWWVIQGFQFNFFSNSIYLIRHKKCWTSCTLKYHKNIGLSFIIVRTWKQPRCPSADKWIRKLWYMYTMEYYSTIKKNSLESVLMRWMKLEPFIQSEVSQKDKDQHSILMSIHGM